MDNDEYEAELMIYELAARYNQIVDFLKICGEFIDTKSMVTLENQLDLIRRELGITNG